MRERMTTPGLEHIGLPVAPGVAAMFHVTIGSDIDAECVEALQRGEDWTSEASPNELAAAHLTLTHNPDDLKGADVLVACVPTPIDEHKQPDLAPLRSAFAFIGKWLKKGAIVVCESKAYPGLTEQFCAPLLERESGLWCGTDFSLETRRNRSTLATRNQVLHG